MFTPIQIILTCAFLFFMTFIGMSVQLFVYGVSVFYGFVVGLIMGDIATGLMIGGTMTLMGLGVGGYGGSSVPNYALGTVVGTLFAVVTQGGIESGLAVGIPVATLGIQFDILAKMAGSFFFHREQKAADELNWKAMGTWMWAWNWFRSYLYTLPVLLVMTVGSGLISDLLAAIPQWFMNGMNVAAGMLPGLGFAILMRYLPLKKYGVFLIFGFVMSAYFKLTMLGIALLAFVAAYMVYQNSNQVITVASAGKGDYDE
ncbi:MAG: PTS sugar transporter subunit IIC [Erysipelotrichaceae bacterium]|nr:PTS sugar transporter subunit IIC [Erysipelotrichaceae bacterium]